VRRDETATVVATGTGWNRLLLVNGFSMTILTPVSKVMAHLPLAFHPEPREGLVLCFGMGTTFRSMRRWDIPTTVVELVPSVPELAGYYHADAVALQHAPGAHVVIDDARRYLERTAQRFDVITIDPPPPVEAAASSLLYSQEFYSLVQRRLRPGGIRRRGRAGGELHAHAGLRVPARARLRRDPRVGPALPRLGRAHPGPDGGGPGAPASPGGGRGLRGVGP
jgi:predicted methyltransferase